MHYWLIRAGERGKFSNDFVGNNIIAIGWSELGDLARIDSRADLKKRFRKKCRGASNAEVGKLWTFFSEMRKGDIVLTPNPLTRTIHIGKIKTDYLYKTQALGHMNFRHRRKVVWEKEVSRDVFSKDMKHCLGALQALFSVDKYDSLVKSRGLTGRGA